MNIYLDSVNQKLILNDFFDIKEEKKINVYDLDSDCHKTMLSYLTHREKNQFARTSKSTRKIIESVDEIFKSKAEGRTKILSLKNRTSVAIFLLGSSVIITSPLILVSTVAGASIGLMFECCNEKERRNIFTADIFDYTTIVGGFLGAIVGSFGSVLALNKAIDTQKRLCKIEEEFNKWNKQIFEHYMGREVHKLFPDGL